MKTPLIIIALLALVVAAPAQGATDQVRIDQVQIISTERAQAVIDYRCTGEDAGLSVSVGQDFPEVAGGAFAYSGSAPLDVPCTGRWEEITLTLVYPSGGPTYLTEGFANAGVRLRSPSFEDIVDRKVRLT